MIDMIDHNAHTRMQLNKIAEREGIDNPHDQSRYRNKAELAQAIMERRAAVTPTGKAADDLAAFAPRIYWAVGPESLTPAPRIKHPALGRGVVIKPSDGRYVARTPFEAQLIEDHLVSNGLAFPEDPEDLWDATEGCASCNFHARSVRAMSRHFSACHPMS